MSKKQAEDLRVQIIERRNYLKDMEFPLVYSKTNLYGGMQARVQRKEDKAFNRSVAKQRKLVSKKLKAVDDYLVDLNKYNKAEAARMNAVNSGGGMGVLSIPASQKPVFQNGKMPALPKRARVRQAMKGGRY